METRTLYSSSCATGLSGLGDGFGGGAIGTPNISPCDTGADDRLGLDDMSTFEADNPCNHDETFVFTQTDDTHWDTTIKDGDGTVISTCEVVNYEYAEDHCNAAACLFLQNLFCPSDYCN